MTEFLREFVIRILCGSTICFVALVIVGNGPNREPTRLCCAAVMIILIFSNQNEISLNIDYLSNIKNDLQNEVSTEIDRVRAFEVEKIISATENHIIEEMHKEGISCDIELIYKYDENIVITGVILRNITDETKIDFISKYLINNLYVKESEIIFE